MLRRTNLGRGLYHPRGRAVYRRSAHCEADSVANMVIGTARAKPPGR